MSRKTLRAAFLSVALILSALLYLPGAAGPFVFDDSANLLDNHYIKIESLSPDSLYHAAYSLAAGPLQRPISMLSFALNYYFAGSFENPIPYKITNIVIHAINGLLVFWLVQLVFTQLAIHSRRHSSCNPFEMNHGIWPAFLVSLLWMIHPIQVSSVLYVVQRMTELAALFTIGGLIAYLKGRAALSQMKMPRGVLLIGISLGIFLPLGLLSKENAILMPVFMLVIDIVLFNEKAPWCHWKRLTSFQKRIFIVILVLLAAAAIFALIRYAAPMYVGRQFDMIERFLTQGRVLFFYISLILLPRIDQFGNQHDDIAISTSLFEPWTTTPALLGHAGLFAAAWLARKQRPYLTLGILWFYVGHLLESTIIALEITHEHRNYLPSLGIMLIIVGGLYEAKLRARITRITWLVPGIAIIFAVVSSLRISQWRNEIDFYHFEVLHHPDSPRSLVGYARSLVIQGRSGEAVDIMRRVAALEEFEPGHLMYVAMLEAGHGKGPDKEEHKKILSILRSSDPINTTVFNAIQDISQCLDSSCRTLQIPMEQWLRAILERKKNPGDISFYRYALGRVLLSQGHIPEALEQFRISHELDSIYLHPLLSMARIYIDTGAIREAENILTKLRRADMDSQHPRTRDIDILENDIKRLAKIMK